VLERFGALVLLMWVGIVVAGVMYGFAIFNLAGGSESNAQFSSPGVTADIKLGELFPLQSSTECSGIIVTRVDGMPINTNDPNEHVASFTRDLIPALWTTEPGPGAAPYIVVIETPFNTSYQNLTGIMNYMEVSLIAKLLRHDITTTRQQQSTQACNLPPTAHYHSLADAHSAAQHSIVTTTQPLQPRRVESYFDGENNCTQYPPTPPHSTPPTPHHTTHTHTHFT
jgi:hypothetical protein